MNERKRARDFAQALVENMNINPRIETHILFSFNDINMSIADVLETVLIKVIMYYYIDPNSDLYDEHVIRHVSALAKALKAHDLKANDLNATQEKLEAYDFKKIAQELIDDVIDPIREKIRRRILF